MSSNLSSNLHLSTPLFQPNALWKSHRCDWAGASWTVCAPWAMRYGRLTKTEGYCKAYSIIIDNYHYWDLLKIVIIRWLTQLEWRRVDVAVVQIDKAVELFLFPVLLFFWWHVDHPLLWLCILGDETKERSLSEIDRHWTSRPIKRREMTKRTKKRREEQRNHRTKMTKKKPKNKIIWTIKHRNTTRFGDEIHHG